MANCGKPFAILRITHDVATQIDANEKSPEPCKQILNFLPLSSAFSAMHIKKAPLSRSLLGSTYSVKPKVTIKRCRSVFGQSICFANGNARHFATQNWLRQPLFGGCFAAPFSSGCSAVFSALQRQLQKKRTPFGVLKSTYSVKPKVTIKRCRSV